MTDIVARLRLMNSADSTPREAADEIERLQIALACIVRWADVYPIKVFHEPNADECRRASELLKANGMTLDAFNASMGRHCLMGVGDIARDALNLTKK
jgi:hypothetical protein